MNGRIIHLDQLTEDDEQRWRDLATHAEEPNPLFEAECLVPAAKYLPKGSQIMLVVAEEEGLFFGCFPVIRAAGVDSMIATLPGVRRPVFNTQVRRLRYDGTPLLRAHRGVESASAMLRVLALKGRGPKAGILVMESFDSDGPVLENFRQAAENLNFLMLTYRTWVRPVVRRREDLTYRSIHSGTSLRTYARRGRRLAEELGGNVEFRDRSDDPLAVDEILAIESDGYKGRIGVDVNSHSGENEWLKEMCDQFREIGRVLLYTLQVGEVVAAMHLMIRAGDGLFVIQLVYNEEYSKFSPGIQLHLDVIDSFHIATDAQWIDSCTYEGNETFLRFYPDRRQVSTLLVAVGGRVDRAYVRFYVFALNWFGVNAEFRKRHGRAFASIDRIVSRWKRLSRK